MSFTLQAVLAPLLAKYKISTVMIESLFVSCFVPITVEPVGCLLRRWLVPPAGSSPAVRASVWWWCRLSAPGRRCCLSAGRADTDVGLLWLWGRNHTGYKPIRFSVRYSCCRLWMFDICSCSYLFIVFLYLIAFIVFKSSFSFFTCQTSGFLYSDLTMFCSDYQKSNVWGELLLSWVDGSRHFSLCEQLH